MHNNKMPKVGWLLAPSTWSTCRQVVCMLVVTPSVHFFSRMVLRRETRRSAIGLKNGQEVKFVSFWWQWILHNKVYRITNIIQIYMSFTVSTINSPVWLRPCTIFYFVWWSIISYLLYRDQRCTIFYFVCIV